MKTYSIITKKDAAELYVRCMEGVSERLAEKIQNRLMQLSDVKFMKDFNKLMNLELKMYAPNMYKLYSI